MRGIIREIRSFAEDRETFERTMGVITGVSINLGILGIFYDAIGSMAYEGNFVEQMGEELERVGIVGTVASFAAYGISQGIHLLRKDRSKR